MSHFDKLVWIITIDTVTILITVIWCSAQIIRAIASSNSPHVLTPDAGAK